MKILVCGDSITYPDIHPDINGKKWHQLLSHNNQVIDTSFGNISNDEIIRKIQDQIITDKFDLVIIQWTMILRLTLPRTDRDEGYTFSSMSSDISKEEFKLMDHIWRLHFINRYNMLSKWLTDLTIISDLFNLKNQKYLFIQGFGNNFSDLSHPNWKNCSMNYKQFILNFDQLSDSELDTKHQKLHNKYQLLNNKSKNNWVNLNHSIIENLLDTEKDGLYPGLETHKQIYNMVKSTVEKVYQLKV